MSINYNIELGNPPGMIVDCSMEHYVKVFAEKTDKPLLDCIGDILADKEHIHLALSGGLDSQFSLRYCLELNKTVTAYTYRSIWKDTIINVEDVYLAEQLAKKFKFKHHVIDIDLFEFYNNNEHYNYGPEYLNNTPQLSLHFYFIKLLKDKFNIDHILMGGDPPLIRYNSKITTQKNISITGDKFLQDIMAPYYIFCESIGVECLRDIYYHSPQAVYQSYMNNIDVIKKQGKYAKTTDWYMTSERQRNDLYVYKYEFYKNVINDLMPQKSETTGFENLKKILATETGIYNQFDIQYKDPLIDLDKKSIRARARERRLKYTELSARGEQGKQPTLGKFNRNIKYPQLIKNIYKDFHQYIQENDCTCVNRFNFDF